MPYVYLNRRTLETASFRRDPPFPYVADQHGFTRHRSDQDGTRRARGIQADENDQDEDGCVMMVVVERALFARRYKKQACSETHQQQFTQKRHEIFPCDNKNIFEILQNDRRIVHQGQQTVHICHSHCDDCDKMGDQESSESTARVRKMFSLFNSLKRETRFYDATQTDGVCLIVGNFPNLGAIPEDPYTRSCTSWLKSMVMSCPFGLVTNTPSSYRITNIFTRR